MSQDIGRDVFNGLILRIEMRKQTRLFINLNSVQRILYVLYIPVYSDREIIQPGFCMEKVHGRYFLAKFVTAQMNSEICFEQDSGDHKTISGW